jgi:hypothetical protein
MKKLLLVTLLTFGVTLAFGQRISLTPVAGKSLKAILCNVDTVIFKSNYNISIILYKISNGSGSAHMPGTDEVSNKFLIAVSSIDEVPDQYLYSLGDFINPKVIQFQPLKRASYLLSIEYGTYKNRKKINLDISVGKVSIVNR